MESIDVLNAVVGENPQGRCKSTIAFFVEKAKDEGPDSLLDEFIVAKPIVEISEFADANENEYYCIEFYYKSRRDEDLKQQWQFLERYITKHVVNASAGDNDSGAGEQEGELIPSLSISFMPESLNGKYSMFAKGVLPDSIIRVEYAGENLCSIRVLVLKENVTFWSHSEELVDRRQLEAEVAREIDASLLEEYGPIENNRN